MGVALREDTTSEAGGLAISVLGHIGRAGDRAGRAGTLAVEEDQEDQGTHEGKTTDHTDDDTGNGAATQLVAVRCRSVGRGRILGTSLASGGNGDGLDLTS